jgi:hypothetical protein
LLVQFAAEFDWKAAFPELQAASFAEIKKFDAVDHLMHVDIGKIYKMMEQDTKFGLLGAMARASKASLAALPAESFCERIISAGNIVLTKENLRLDPKRTEKMALPASTGASWSACASRSRRPAARPTMTPFVVAPSTATVP